MSIIKVDYGSIGRGINSFYQKYANLPQTIDLGFKPKYVIVSARYGSNTYMTFIYDADTSTTTFIRIYGNNKDTLSIPSPSNYAGFNKVGSDNEIQFNSYYNELHDAYVMAIKEKE